MIDVGCGPAYYIDRLPEGVNYHGFDTSERYIDWSRSKFGDRAAFTVGTFDSESAANVGRVDAFALFGLLHHLPDDVALDLLGVIGEVLSPEGRVVTVDIVTFEGQGRLDRWITEHDRGEFPRSVDAWEALVRKRFARVEMELMKAHGRMLSSHLLVKMAEPIVQ